MTRRFQDLETYTHDDVAAAIARDEPEELQRAVIEVAMEDSDRELAETVCIQLAQHWDPTVRGNALLGFGHLARRFGQLALQGRKLVEAGLSDSDPHVRAQASSAADDIKFFLK